MARIPPLPSDLKSSRPPEKRARIQHKPYCVCEQLWHSESFSSRSGGNPPQISAPRCQVRTSLASRPKASSLRAEVLTFWPAYWWHMDRKRRREIKGYHKKFWPEQLEGWHCHLMRWEDSWEGWIWSSGSDLEFSLGHAKCKVPPWPPRKVVKDSALLELGVLRDMGCH